MKIGLVHYSAPPVVGGVESVVGHHARLMAAAGHTVRVVAGRGVQWTDAIEFAYLPLLDSRHPRVLAVKAELDAGRVPPDFATLVGEISTALRVALADIDTVIAHNVCSLHLNLALTAGLRAMHARPGASRLILWHHDLAWTTPRYRAELHPGYPWDLLRTDWGARHVAVSEVRRRELAALMELPRQAITVIPNGVEIAHFFKLERRTQGLVGHLKLAQAGPLLLLPVRLTPRKNIELALRILAALRQELPRAMLVITGPLGAHSPLNADYFAQLKALRAELNLTGAAHFLAESADIDLPDAVIADFYRLADALLLPSREEGFGLPLIEAAFSHVPVFCADILPLRELGGDNVTYFSPGDSPDAIAGLLATTFRTDRIYRFAARARRQFAWGRVYADHIAPLLST